MKCRVCREPAIIDIRRHNANFCTEHFLRLCRDQTVKAIEEFDMLAPGDRVLVAVSGGKDSLAVWDILLDLGYDADGLYLGLGIGEYSDSSGEFARAYATKRGVKLIEVDLPADYGYDIPTGARAAKRVPCSACGLSKRHLFDQAAIEATSPGTKHDFYFGFLSRASAHFRPQAEGEQADLLPCISCGAPTTTEVCAFCRLVERAGGQMPERAPERSPEPVAVSLGPTRSAGAGQ